MPEPRGDVPDDVGVDADSEIPAHRDALDVPEWVSEMRRLYVEPKTRARMREEGAIAPQKRQRGLAGVRARRSGPPPVEAGVPLAPAQPVVPAPLPEPSEHTEPEAVTPEEGSELRVPLPTDARDPAPLDGGERPASDHPHEPPGALDEDTRVVAPAAGAGSAPVQPTGQEDVSTWLTSYLSATGHGDDEEDRAGIATADDTSEDDVEEPPLASTEHEEVPVRSLAELAGLVEPDDGWPQPFGRAATPLTDAEAHDPMPEQPDTVPAATLSRREPDVADVSVPGAETDHEAILVEPPSQAAAQSRVRRRPPDLGTGADAEGGTADRGDAGPPSPVAVVAEPPPRTRASARAAGSHSGRRRRLLVLVLSLVVLAVVATYLLLAGPGAAAG